MGENKKDKMKAVITSIASIGQNYRIATFNIRIFSRQSVLGQKKDLAAIADIIIKNKIDIIAIQEILHKEALKSLIEELAQRRAKKKETKTAQTVHGLVTYGKIMNDVAGYIAGDWEGRWAKPQSKYGHNSSERTDTIAEGYAFLWNTRRIQLVTNHHGKVFEPRIGFNLKENVLIRPPFVGRFMPTNSRYEFRLINTHIGWEESKQKEEGQRLNPDELREKELLVLLRTVYSSFSLRQYDVTGNDKDAKLLPSYTFLLGDYNLNLSSKATNKNAMMPSELREYTNGKLRIITVNEKLTTLKATAPSNEDIKCNTGHDAYLANNYDHFSYDQERLIQHNIADPKVDVVYAFDYLTNREDGLDSQKTQYEKYREKVSDHLPVILDVNIKKKRSG